MVHSTLAFSVVGAQTLDGPLDKLVLVLQILIFLGVGIAWPIWIVIFMRRNKDRLEIPSVYDQFHALYKDYWTDTTGERLYQFWFCARRLSFVLALVLLHDRKLAVRCLVITSQCVYLMYIYRVKPHKEELFNLIEVFNESLIFLMLDLELATKIVDPRTQYQVGNLVIAVTAFIFIANNALLFCFLFKNGKLYLRRRENQRLHQEALSRSMMASLSKSTTSNSRKKGRVIRVKKSSDTFTTMSTGKSFSSM